MDQVQTITITADDVDFWSKRWEDGNTGWHVNKVHPMLIKYFDKLTENNQGQGDVPKKIFVPLCGKTMDLAWLLSKGYTVFGIEAVKKPIEELDSENSFGLEFNESESVYSTKDGRLQIFLGDLAQCPIEKWAPFDYVWDRASLTAVEYSFRETYIKVMQRSLKTSKSGNYCDFRYLLNVIEYDKSKFAGPPRSTHIEDVQNLYSQWTNVTLLEKNQLPEGDRIRKIPDMTPDCNTCMYILTPKSHLNGNSS